MKGKVELFFFMHKLQKWKMQVQNMQVQNWKPQVYYTVALNMQDK